MNGLKSLFFNRIFEMSRATDHPAAILASPIRAGIAREDPSKGQLLYHRPSDDMATAWRFMSMLVNY